jgi:type IV pilus assembly protein PilE
MSALGRHSHPSFLRGLQMRSMQRGFTLIELMIVVAVIAILAAVAYPAYNDQVRKSRRAQAKANLVEYAQLAERHFTVNNSYAGFQAPTNKTPFYTVATTVDAATFTLTATAQGAQAQDKCGDLSITNTGAKAKTGSAPLSDCW